jgi:hypothetical protein
MAETSTGPTKAQQDKAERLAEARRAEAWRLAKNQRRYLGCMTPKPKKES